MKLLDISLYKEDIKRVASMNLLWEAMQGSSIMISGATGMIGSFLIDVLMYKNSFENLNCSIYALTRNRNKAEMRFANYLGDSKFNILECDINKEINLGIPNMDYIFHAASNTHPVAYSTQPIETILTNIVGTNNLLEYAVKSNSKSFIFASTVEVYGENRGDVDEFKEEYCGYINCNTLRSGYPESKRAGEALCQAYKKEKNLNVIIPRLSRVFGPTMLMSDTKAISQFIKNGVLEQDIILKSEGNQLYSYAYVADAVSAILTCLFSGESGIAYNISNSKCDITLKELAEIIANYSNTKVVFELPSAIERQGYSTATKAILDNSKLKSLGWEPKYNMEEAVIRTIEILKRVGV